MKLRKKLIATVVAAVAVCAVALTGCQQKLEPADQVVGALYDLAAKDDPVPMKNLLGFASEAVSYTHLVPLYSSEGRGIHPYSQRHSARLCARGRGDRILRQWGCHLPPVRL